MNNKRLDHITSVFTGVAMIVVPLVFIVAFASHPNLFSLEIVGFEAWILEFRRNLLWQYAHGVVMFCTPLLVVVGLGLRKLVDEGAPWLGLVGASLTVFGAIMLAGDKGALFAAVSAIDTLPDPQFAGAVPALQAIWDGAGWMWMFRTVPLYFTFVIGMLLLGIGLFRSQVVPRWQSGAIIAAMLMFFNPDIDLISLIASVVLLAGLAPIGLRFITEAGDSREQKHIQDLEPAGAS